MAEGFFHAAGEVDASSADAFRSALDDVVSSHDGDVYVDCSKLMFIDSSGLSVLVATHRKLDASGRQLRVANASGIVARVLAIAGLTELLHVNETTGFESERTT
jgi:anti-sigma B factor antagonist